MTVAYATVAGSATAANDFVATSGTLTFAPGVTSLTISVAIVGDRTGEPTETFTVVLSSPVNAAIASGDRHRDDSRQRRRLRAEAPASAALAPATGATTQVALDGPAAVSTPMPSAGAVARIAAERWTSAISLGVTWAGGSPPAAASSIPPSWLARVLRTVVPSAGLRFAARPRALRAV